MLRRSALRSIVAAACLFSADVTARAQDPPRVHLIATGGTIAGGSEGSLTADGLRELLPELGRIAHLSVEDFSTIGSSRMTPELQLRLARRVNELFSSAADLSGIVITHGTDSLEESAFFLDLLLASDRPVIFAAAQRPPRMTDSDGPRNLLNAVRLAASPALSGFGVLVTLNDEIHAARDVRKTHSIALEAFRSPGAGPIGHLDSGRIFLFYRPLRRLRLDIEAVESRVDLIPLVAGSDGHLVRASVASGAKGIVLEVFGRGNVPPPVMQAVREAREKGVVVAFTTRTGGGRVELGREARELGVVSAEDLDGLKARILLVATLGATQSATQIQSYFTQLSGEAAGAPSPTN